MSAANHVDLPAGPADDGISERRRAFDDRVVGALLRALVWISRHWLLVINSATAAMVGFALLSPALGAAGWPSAGNLIFSVYHLACHQLPERSFFIFERQIALCQRDLAMYVAILLAGLLYGACWRGVRPLPVKWYLLMLLPLALDGGTQLLGWRESSWPLRVATGALFGLANVWLLFPHLDEAMAEIGREASADLQDASITTGETPADRRADVEPECRRLAGEERA